MQRGSLQFEIHPSSGTPIYRQLMDQVQALISSSRLVSGELLPSVRQVAGDLEVNMMTVSKAYAKLEADGILQRVRGKGMRVAEPATATASLSQRKKELKPLIELIVTRGIQLGLTDEQILAVTKSVLKERRS